MKKLIAYLTCTAMVAGSLVLGTSAADDGLTKTPKLITAAPVGIEMIAELDALLAPLGLPIDTQTLVSGLMSGALGSEQLTAMLAGVDPALVSELMAKLSALLAPADEEEAADDFIKLEIAATDRNTNVVFGDSNVTGGAAVVSGAPAENTFAASAYKRFTGDTAVFAAGGATTEALVYLLEDEESAAILAQNAKNAKFWTINMGGNDLLHALTDVFADVDFNLTIDQSAVLAAASALVPSPELITPEVLATVTEQMTAELIAPVIEKITAAATEASASLIANLNKFIAFAQNANPNLKVFVNGIPTIDLAATLTYVGKPEFTALVEMFDYAALVDGINLAIESALPENAYFIDVDPIIAEVEAPFNADGIHFTDEAQAVLGDEISNIITTTNMKTGIFRMMIAR